MEAEKKLVCTCEKCGNEAEMTVKCEEMVPPAAGEPKGARQLVRRTMQCSVCGGEVERTDYAPVP